MIVAWKAAPSEGEEQDALIAAKKLGLRHTNTVTVSPFDESRNRSLYLYEKYAETPSGFPRRPGMARKRPLSGRADHSKPPSQ
jgi:16S rRNA (guanine527-N7)-methyltransferase